MQKNTIKNYTTLFFNDEIKKRKVDRPCTQNQAILNTLKH